MGKRNPSFHPDQRDFFAAELPRTTPPAPSEGALAGIDRRIASAVSLMIMESGLGRHEVAINVSEMLDDTVTKAMLDAYASEAREGHNISAGRLLALTAVTHGYGILNSLLREIGGTLLVGEEILTAQLGHKQRQMKILAEEIALLKRSAPLITKGRR